jgi:hypothetical protein
VSRKAVVIAVVAALVVALVVLLVWQPFDDGPSIETGALGVWQESTDDLPVRMTVSARDGVESGDGGPEYWVTHPQRSDAPFPARLDGEMILVFDADGQDVLYSIIYDDGADVLIVSQPGGGDTFILRRISE